MTFVEADLEMLHLAAGDSRLERLFDAALDAVIAMDAAGNIAAWNKTAEKIFGWTRTEALGRPLAETVIPPGLRQAHHDGLRRYRETNEGPVINARVEVTAMRRDGSEFPVELTVIPLRSEAGDFFYAFLRDITDRKQAERLAQQRALEAQVLYEAAEIVARGGSVEKLLNFCLEKICHVTGWTVGHVYYPDSPLNPVYLLPTGIWYIADPKLRDLEAVTQGYSMRRGEGLPGRIWASGEPEWIEDIGTDTGFPRREAYARFGLKTAFGFPVLLEGRLQAVLEFFAPVAQRPDETLMLVARSLAEQLGRVLERQDAQEHQQLLMRELDHRVANSLAVIRSVFRRTADGASSARDLKEVFEARLQSIANAHRLLASGGWTSATMRELAEATLEPYGGEAPSYSLSGPDVHLPSKTVMDLTMVLHELATNAAKYGALAVPEGRVDLKWQVTDQANGAQVEVEWQEIGGPPVHKPDHQGFGLTLINTLIRRNLKGDAQLEYEPAGFRALFVVPLRTPNS